MQRVFPSTFIDMMVFHAISDLKLSTKQARYICSTYFKDVQSHLQLMRGKEEEAKLVMVGFGTFLMKHKKIHGGNLENTLRGLDTEVYRWSLSFRPSGKWKDWVYRDIPFRAKVLDRTQYAITELRSDDVFDAHACFLKAMTDIYHQNQRLVLKGVCTIEPQVRQVRDIRAESLQTHKVLSFKPSKCPIAEEARDAA